MDTRDSTGLFRVQIDPKAIYEVKLIPTLPSQDEVYYGRDGGKVRILLDAYSSFKPSLEEKFGKPSKENIEDRGQEVELIKNILNRQARLQSVWETEESLITLTVEVKPSDLIKGGSLLFSSFLIYEKKKPKDQNKVDL